MYRVHLLLKFGWREREREKKKKQEVALMSREVSESPLVASSWVILLSVWPHEAQSIGLTLDAKKDSVARCISECTKFTPAKKGALVDHKERK